MGSLFMIRLGFCDVKVVGPAASHLESASMVGVTRAEGREDKRGTESPDSSQSNRLRLWMHHVKL